MEEEELYQISYDIRGLRLEYKTTCDAYDRWPGGDPQEQIFLEQKKKKLFRLLAEHCFDKS